MSATALRGGRRRTRVRVEGTVQGVGFRPYVYRLARELELDGYVLNDPRGVLLEVEGADAAVDRFLARLGPSAPPLARVERVLCSELHATRRPGFEIRASPTGESANAPVTPDTAVCEDCLRELRDPADRRYRYPFINCTNCGPRFTIVRGVPYDRPLTTMSMFTMCPGCRSEYEDPADRRFHAQPNACPACGPSLTLLGRGREPIACERGRDAVQIAAAALRGGAILALKGIGGYHLACRADHEQAVARLRADKHRAEKPFALMAADLRQAAALVELDERARELLRSPERPIVLAPRLADAAVAGVVAPGTPELGVMLPYSPLHHLLLADARTPLVMTSGNVSDEPIAYRDDDALWRLSGIADLFLLHDRAIETRTDDSVVRVIGGSDTPGAIFLRRSRGYVPAPLALPEGGTARPLLACGAELKNTFCVAKGTRAWVSHHIGDLENFETLCSFTEGVEHFQRLFAVAPALVAHDMHPGYLSTQYALEREHVEHLAVQHHHAHLAACLAEHGETGPAVGAIFDGTGYGLDGTIWGGELLYGGLSGFERVGALRPTRLPGGAAAIRQPWRMACAWLAEIDAAQQEPPPTLAGIVPARRWRQISALVGSGPVTTSAGRLFDAVAALCGIRSEISYEGQAAIELEAASEPGARGSYPMQVLSREGFLVLDPAETLHAILADLRRGERPGAVSARFHRALATGTARACARAAESRATGLAVLSGGAFANRLLLAQTVSELARAGLRVLVPRRLPPGDGGISYGQAAVAAAGGAR